MRTPRKNHPRKISPKLSACANAKKPPPHLLQPQFQLLKWKAMTHWQLITAISL
ncbi:hypothetical protein ACS0TY_032476 [Phlomoides rotata]